MFEESSFRLYVYLLKTKNICLTCHFLTQMLSSYYLPSYPYTTCHCGHKYQKMKNQEIQMKLKEIGIHQKDLVEILLQEGQINVLEKESPVIKEGAFIKSVSIVLDGEVRVWKNSEEGKQILLYYVNPVQTCVMSLASTYRDKISVIEARTTQRTTVLSLPAWGLDGWMKFENWRKFVIFSFIHSYDDILRLYSEIAFNKLDERLESFFKDYTIRKNTNKIFLSHSDIAREMGTSREVISRVLKNMEQEKKLRLGLKNIELLL